MVSREGEAGRRQGPPFPPTPPLPTISPPPHPPTPYPLPPHPHQGPGPDVHFGRPSGQTRHTLGVKVVPGVVSVSLR